jgi:hypothetical protein
MQCLKTAESAQTCERLNNKFSCDPQTCYLVSLTTSFQWPMYMQTYMAFSANHESNFLSRCRIFQTKVVMNNENISHAQSVI